MYGHVMPRGAAMMEMNDMTLAQRYNAKIRKVMPHMAVHLCVDAGIDDASQIDEIVFRRSEYLGGMAAVILELVRA